MKQDLKLIFYCLSWYHIQSENLQNFRLNRNLIIMGFWIPDNLQSGIWVLERYFIFTTSYALDHMNFKHFLFLYSSGLRIACLTIQIQDYSPSGQLLTIWRPESLEFGSPMCGWGTRLVNIWQQWFWTHLINAINFERGTMQKLKMGCCWLVVLINVTEGLKGS